MRRVAPGVAQQHGQAQADQLFGQQFIAQVGLQLAQLAALAQHQLAQALQLHHGETGGVHVFKHVSPVVVGVVV